MDTITLTGIVATPPRHIVTGEGLQITSFRLASTQRRFDRAEQKWVDADTNWYTVTCFRALAANVVGSILKGQRVIVIGSLRVREWEAEEKSGVTIEVDADAIGHDLTFGTSVFTRAPAQPTEPTEPE
jgi:single-strand DNA-binding protein